MAVDIAVRTEFLDHVARRAFIEALGTVGFARNAFFLQLQRSLQYP